MRLLFVHGGEKVKKDSRGAYYTDGSYNESIWKKYSLLSRDITVIFRKDNKTYNDAILHKKFNKIPSGINIIEIEDKYSSLSSLFSLRRMIRTNKMIESPKVFIDGDSYK